MAVSISEDRVVVVAEYAGCSMDEDRVLLYVISLGVEGRRGDRGEGKGVVAFFYTPFFRWRW